MFTVKKTEHKALLIFREKGRSGDEPLLQLTHSHVVGIKSRESLLIGEIGLESDGHE